MECRRHIPAAVSSVFVMVKWRDVLRPCLTLLHNISHLPHIAIGQSLWWDISQDRGGRPWLSSCAETTIPIMLLPLEVMPVACNALWDLWFRHGWGAEVAYPCHRTTEAWRRMEEVGNFNAQQEMPKCCQDARDLTMIAESWTASGMCGALYSCILFCYLYDTDPFMEKCHSKLWVLYD